MSREKIVILGAGGRDFHVFNTVYRDDESTRVVAFTAAQIPHIDDRRYPPSMSGPLYPDGVPIVAEDELEALVAENDIQEVVFAYSDVSFETIDAIRRRVEATGARFRLFDPEASLLESSRPVIAVCAVRTGCGKSPVSRHLCRVLRDAGLRVAVIRHPMPYGELDRQVAQRFATLEDLDRHDCTIEEREEYEPHIEAGSLVFAGADYAEVLAAAEAECDVILWDGGNNDAPFIRPDLLVTLLDPLRAGDELRYFPSGWNLDNADVLLVSKSGQASPEQLETVSQSARQRNPGALLLLGDSPVTLDEPEAVRGKRALVVEDGPTTTHGGMGYGAGWVAATQGGAAEIVDPRPFARGEIAEVFQDHPALHDILPAIGYSQGQLDDLQATIADTDCEVVVIGTPIDLTKVIRIDKPTVRARYRFADDGSLGRAVLENEKPGLNLSSPG